MEFAVLIIGLLYFLSRRKISAVAPPTTIPSIPSPPTTDVIQSFTGRTTNTLNQIRNALNGAGLSPKGALIGLAQAMAESRNTTNTCQSCGYNYWNFGFPSWWRNYHSETERWWGKCPRADEVGYTISFISLEYAVLSYLEICQRSKPAEFYENLVSPEPDIELFIYYICEPGEQWAGLCSTGQYQTTIRNLYEQMVLNGVP